MTESHPETPDVQLKNLKKSFGTVAAVNGVSINIEAGQLATLLGPSGCGKTTTLRMIAGLEVPDQGSITIGDRVIFDKDQSINILPEKRNLGMVFQSYAIWPHKTVFENIAYPLRLRRVPRSQIRDRVKSVLEMLGMGGFEDRPATKLSGGQQQRVALARSLVFEPQLLLLDEPLSNLDAKLREQMRFELKAMQRRIGITTIYVTHDQEEALALSDRVVVMNSGKVEQDGPPNEIYQSPASLFVADFIGKMNFIPVKGLKVEREGLASGLLETFNGPIRVFAQTGPAPHPAEEATLAIRPEKIQLANSKAPDPSDEVNVVPGQVKARAYLGDRLEHMVAVNGNTTLRVVTSAEEARPVDTAVELICRSRDIFIFFPS